MNSNKEILQEFDIIGLSVSLAVSFFVPFLITYTITKNSKEDKDLSNKINTLLKNDIITWKVKILPTDMINAFSTGTENVFITKKLRELLTEEECLAVMLHEVAHSRFLHAQESIFTQLGLTKIYNWLSNKITHKIAKIIIKKQGIKKGLKLSLSLVSRSVWWWETLLILIYYALLISINRYKSYYKEKQADYFAIQLGYGEHLASALRKISNSAGSWKPPIYMKPLLYAMQIMNKHPELEERLIYCMDDNKIEKNIKDNDKSALLKNASNILRGKNE